MPLFAMTVGEAAESAAIPRVQLEGLILTGHGPKARKAGRRAIILREDFEKWLASLPEADLANMDEYYAQRDAAKAAEASPQDAA